MWIFIDLILQKSAENNSYDHITRTIKVIFLSQFLQFVPAVNIITLSRKPGYAPLPICIPLYRDSKVASIQLVPRYCASAFEPTFCTVTQKRLPLVCTAITPARNQFASGRQKLRHASLTTAFNRFLL